MCTTQTLSQSTTCLYSIYGKIYFMYFYLLLCVESRVLLLAVSQGCKIAVMTKVC